MGSHSLSQRVSIFTGTPSAITELSVFTVDFTYPPATAEAAAVPTTSLN
ncbi:hypothetical protein SDJN02_04657, partial [Cucurbita argyrosperma subsp. argyrosperma]